MIYFCVQGSDISSMVSQCLPQPMVIIIGQYRDPIQAFLVYQRKIVCEIPTKDIPISVLLPYYIINMYYTKGSNNFYTFIQAGIFNKNVTNLSLIVGATLTRLNALNLEHVTYCIFVIA